MGLAHNGSNFSKVGLEHGGGDGRGISDLDCLVMGLVRGGNGQKSCTDKCLKYSEISV